MKGVLKKIIPGVLLILILTVPAQAVEQLTLMLDWFPNVDHVPLYVAKAQGLFADEGVDVEILSPSGTTDALKLAASGNVDLAIAYEPQVIMAAAEGLDITVVGRLVEHPLSVLLFLKGKGIEKPADLEGRTIGYTVPGMMDILTQAFAKKNGIRSYRLVNVGFAIVQSLVSGKVDAVMGPYRNYEVVELEEKGYDAGYFDLVQWGIPDYDELVVITGGKVLREKSAAVRGFVSALERSIASTVQDPAASLELYFTAVPEAPRDMETKAFAITLPLFARSQEHDAARWQAFADFAAAEGLIRKRVEVTKILGSGGIKP